MNLDHEVELRDALWPIERDWVHFWMQSRRVNEGRSTNDRSLARANSRRLSGERSEFK